MGPHQAAVAIVACLKIVHVAILSLSHFYLFVMGKLL
jgi:hypothetical protein